jgi:hypothetical protein
MRPSVESAAGGDRSALRLFLSSLAADLDSLKTATGNVSSNSDKQTPLNPTPVQARFNVLSHGGGLVSTTILNPQFVNTRIPGKKRGNLARTPLTHRVRYSTDPTFRTGVTVLPDGVQTHYLLPTGGKPHYFEVRSSVDGVHYNAPQVSGPHK